MNSQAKPEIPILDLKPETESIWKDLMASMERVMRSGHFILGPEVDAFEKEVAAFLGVKHAIGLNSGTDALVIGLRALGVKPGDEVLSTPFTFFATAEAALSIGAKPTFVDIDPATLNIDARKLGKAVTSKTKAIIPVHLFGLPCEMDPILEVAAEHQIPVLEDVAQAFGATHRGRYCGAMGEAGAFSFFPSKNLGAFGDGGMVTTNDPEVARTTRILRAHGSEKKYHNEVVGYNSRLDELQAAVLRVKLRKIEAWNAGRRAAANRYTDELSKVPGIVVPAEPKHTIHVYHQYTIRTNTVPRDKLVQLLKQEGIGTMVYYPVPLHKLPVLANHKESYPESEKAAARVLSLPIGPFLPSSSQQRVIDAIRATTHVEAGTSVKQ
ncbi:MAG TPA: DegT/DnrJ/EryC1/StrS family aminotransferase [Candidatus Thermoplasmatota archaeon]